VKQKNAHLVAIAWLTGQLGDWSSLKAIYSANHSHSATFGFTQEFPQMTSQPLATGSGVQ
jgi:hypothetical protein